MTETAILIYILSGALLACIYHIINLYKEVKKVQKRLCKVECRTFPSK